MEINHYGEMHKSAKAHYRQLEKDEHNIQNEILRLIKGTDKT